MPRVFLCILCGEKVDIRDPDGEDYLVTRVEHEDTHKSMPITSARATG
jgi:hypothetical protein